MLCAVFAYALLLNGLLAALSDVRAIAAAMDPLSGAAICDNSGADPHPAPLDGEHQPDCAMCAASCPMAGSMQGLDTPAIAMVSPPASDALAAVAHPALGIDPPSVYRSDTGAQAPPPVA